MNFERFYTTGSTELPLAKYVLHGHCVMPGDKSISHRCLMLAALASGCSHFTNVSTGDDVTSTRTALEAMGAVIEDEASSSTNAPDSYSCHVTGIPASSFLWTHAPLRTEEVCLPEPVALQCNNSGTTARLISGICANFYRPCVLHGDSSLSRRDMERVARPLRQLGAHIDLTGTTLPLRTTPSYLSPATICLESPSAQVKSALLLAALHAPGITHVQLKQLSRDHTERLLHGFGARFWAESADSLYVHGAQPLHAVRYDIPGDISSAAFIVAAALLCSGSDVHIDHVGLNPTRRAFLDVLKRAGACVAWEEYENNALVAVDEALDAHACAGAGKRAGESEGVSAGKRACFNQTLSREKAGGYRAACTSEHAVVSGDPSVFEGEPCGSIHVQSNADTTSRASWRGFHVSAEEVAFLIDELPMLALLAARASTPSVFSGVDELRAKETDRVAAIERLLAALGAHTDFRNGALTVSPVQQSHFRPVHAFDTQGDHRLAMCALVASLVCSTPFRIINTQCVSVSFPSFLITLERLLHDNCS